MATFAATQLQMSMSGLANRATASTGSAVSRHSLGFKSLKFKASSLAARADQQGAAATSDVAVAEQREKLQSLGGVVSDASVPEGHKGLHGFLYGSEDASVHDGTAAYKTRPGEDDGTERLPLESWASARESERLAGVYAVYSESEELQYIGFSRSIVNTLRVHQKQAGTERAAHVRVRVYTEVAMLTRARLDEERQRWLAAAGAVPVGNGPELHLWEAQAGRIELSVMSEQERTEYEEKKLKMRKAMGENIHDAVEGEEDDARTRREKLMAAVQGDDWSSVIDGQTKSTLRPPLEEAAPASPSSAPVAEAPAPIVSPFMRPGAPVVGGGAERAAVGGAPVELTVESVDAALEEVRPYLIADGGNVEVVGVEKGIVAVRMQGACGTCASSAATMKMGIERTLRNQFGDAIREVVQVDAKPTGATLEAVVAHLQQLLPAIRNYKGDVQVVSVDTQRGHCQVKYKGPKPLSMAISATIKDRFPDMHAVEIIDFE